MESLVNHPQRCALNHELHTHPAQALTAPAQLSYLALATDSSTRQAEYECIAGLCTRYGVPAPAADLNHFLVELGPLRLQWERYTECTSYTFLRPGEFDHPFARPVIASVAPDWLESLPGQVLVAAHVALSKSSRRAANIEEWVALLESNPIVGSRIGDGVATAVTDFRIHADGFSRFLIEDVSLTPRQAGRMVQRLLEIETYLMRALLTLPLTHATMPVLADADQRLATLTNEMMTVTSDEEPALLDRLTRLAATIESTVSSTHHRISAARAYHAQLERRITDLRELRLEGVLTFREFIERRLAPAMSTIEAMARQQESLSQRVNRASDLLRTRVDISLQQQNQTILSATARRAKLQLRLQETVEGLSVAAISYYMVGLIGYVTKAAKAAGATINPDIVTGVAIPIVVIVAALGVRHIRHTVQRATT